MGIDPVARARQFFQQNGRDIDRACFDFHFGALPLGALLAIHGEHQNLDGDFGCGLEVDIKATDSNPFATELALLICLQAGVSRVDPLLAPWYQAWQWPNLNPACCLAGLLRVLGLGSENLHARVGALFERLARPADLAGDDFYAVRPYAYYFLPEWLHPQRELYLSGVLWWLIRQHAGGRLAGAAHFFVFVREPASYTGARMPPAIISEQLDNLSSAQADDGGWPTAYDSGWRGWVTVQNLQVLRAFGRA